MITAVPVVLPDSKSLKRRASACFKLIEPFIDSVVATGDKLGLLGLFLGMVFQAIIAPIPSEVFYLPGLLSQVNEHGSTMGVVRAVPVAILGQLVGMLINLHIGRVLSRPILLKFIGADRLTDIDSMIERFGARGLFFLQLTPLSPVDSFAYALGATSFKSKEFTMVSFLTVTIRVSFVTALVLLGVDSTIAAMLIAALTFTSMIGAGIAVRNMREAYRIEQEKNSQEIALERAVSPHVSAD